MEIHFELISLIIFHILMAISVSMDCKAKAIVNSKAYTILTFFFPVITGIVYACTRNNAKRAEEMPEDASQLTVKSKRFCVLAIVALIISAIVGQLMQ